jgi:hypothetical protein
MYDWASETGKKILEKLEKTYGEETAKKRMRTILLNLRSELLPEKFRRELLNYILEITPEVDIPEKIRQEEAWKIDEFYRYSTAILAAFYNVLMTKEKKPQAGGEKSA